MQNVRNILFIKLKSMGDVVFTLPAIRLLRANFPDARITYFTSAENRAIVAAFTEVDDVIVLDRGAFKRGKLATIGSSTLDLFRRLRGGRFSLVIDLQCYAETAAMACLTHARQRWGYQLGRRLRRFAYTHSLPRNDDIHPVDANLGMLIHFGLKSFPVDDHFRLSALGRAEAGEFFAQQRVDPGQPFLFIQPFTSSTEKSWTLENHLAVAQHFRSRGRQVVFGGGPAERARLQPALDAGFPVCAGLSLASVGWILDRAALVIGGDTGVLHLAAGLGRRVLMLLEQPRPGSCIPYRHPDWVLSSGRPKTLLTIAPQQVIEAAERALAETHPASSCPLPA